MLSKPSPKHCRRVYLSLGSTCEVREKDFVEIEFTMAAAWRANQSGLTEEPYNEDPVQCLVLVPYAGYAKVLS